MQKGRGGMQLGYCAITWGGLAADATGVTSVKDLFYRVTGSIPQAVREIAESGYRGVELFDGNVVELGPEMVRDLVAEAGLELVSVYTGANFVYPDALPDELDRIERAAAAARRAGAGRLVVGGGAPRAAGPREDDYATLGAALDRVVAIAEEHGLAASYHPHLGTIVERPDQLARVMDVSRIALCPDTAHLAAGGADPVAIIDTYAERIAHVHLKDLHRPATFLPLGDGELDFAGIVDSVRRSGYDSWVMVELDYFDGAPVDAARRSKEFLDDLLAVSASGRD